MPAAATAPALVVVGALMIRGVLDIEWRRFEEALPGLLCVAVMRLTFSIANGLAVGILPWVGIRAVRAGARDRARALDPGRRLLAFLFFLEPF